jgi:hypothetical protein
MTLPDPAIDPRRWMATDVHSRFHDEHIAFGVSCRFAAAAAKAARLGNELLIEEFADFRAKVVPRYPSPEDYLIAHLFVGHISAFELFLQDLAMVVLRKYPQKIASQPLKLGEVLQLDDIEDVVFKVAEDVVRKFSYKKPQEYLADICEILSYDSRAVEGDWQVFVEAKARRDLGVHAGWICNETYLRKLSESKIASTLKTGELALPSDWDYRNRVAESLYRMAGELYRNASERLRV